MEEDKITLTELSPRKMFQFSIIIYDWSNSDFENKFVPVKLLGLYKSK